MADFGSTFDASKIEPSTYEVLPAGKYIGQIIDSEMRVTRDGRGQFLELVIEIFEGQYAGRKLFERLNLINPNPDTVLMSQRTLSAICRAVGKLQVTNSDELHFLPMQIDVRVRPPKNEYGESNAMKYYPRVGITPARGAAAASGAPAPSASNTMPWKRQG